MGWFPGLVDPISEPEQQGRPVNWAHQPEQVQKHLLGLKAVLAGLQQKPDIYQAQGDGIVIVGGGPYWPGIVIGLRLLRDTGSEIPVEIWHRDDEAVNPRDVARLGPVTLVNATKHAAKGGGARILRGWEQKLYALAHSRFGRTLFLDADAYCVARPEPLLDLLAFAPFVFWQDMDHNEHTVKWAQVWPSGPDGVPPVQGGQLMLDRAKCWRLILAAHWMCQHSDFYFSHMFGDQDTWRVVLAAMGNPDQWHNLGKAPWVAKAFVVGGTDGKPRVIHRCQGKLFRIKDIPHGREGYNSPQWQLPKEDKVFQYLAEYLAQEQGTAEETFGEIYKKALWGGTSGPGSLPAESKPYVNLINLLLELGSPASVVDLGCGDGQIGTNLKALKYTGVDCHKPHIERLQREAPGKEWLHLDFFKDRDKLPGGEWCLVKDVLHHWPSAWVTEWIRWAQASGKWRRIFFTQDCHQHTDKADCHLGGYRALNPAYYPLKEFPLRQVVQYLHKEVLMLEC